MKGKEQTAEVCLLPVAAMLGRQEYILRTVTFVERYHSVVSCTVNVGVSPGFTVFLFVTNH